MDAKRSARRCRRRGGNVNVMETESTIQPRSFLQQAQEASPLASLVTEMGSVRYGGSSRDRGRRTVSMVCIRVRRVRDRVARCATAMKSSTKTSTEAIGCRKWRRSGFGAGNAVAVATDEGAGGNAMASVDGESATRSRRCDGNGRRRRRWALVTSVMVSVTVQNAGGDCVHPIGKARGKANSGGSPGREGMLTASVGTSSTWSQTR
jgi:hypothetical protein